MYVHLRNSMHDGKVLDDGDNILNESAYVALQNAVYGISL